MTTLATNDILNALYNLGCYDGPLSADIKSQAAQTGLKRFQADVGLTTDGLYGPNTEGKLLPYLPILAKAPDRFKRAARWRLTTYGVVGEGQYSGAKTVPLFDAKGAVLSLVSGGFFANASLEGSARLADGRLLSVAGGARHPVDGALYQPVLDYAKKALPGKEAEAGITIGADGKVSAAGAFEVVAAQGIGYGVQRGINYSPYRTLAADLGCYGTSDPRYKGKGGLVPAGTKVWIAELVGMNLGGGIHDGWMTVNDTGSAIFGQHFDLFVGEYPAKVRMPDYAHIWFEICGTSGAAVDNVANRVPISATYGLTK